MIDLMCGGVKLTKDELEDFSPEELEILLKRIKDIEMDYRVRQGDIKEVIEGFRKKND
ncbi:hypothetical protein [Bacillus infantis]|uniref:hypothetical protein n=1 Tax=Bacillus infantis TaxID=324767 RepID=UPI0020A1E25E|nr:hypothetical protein [Bacillus infantis]MCP1159342.1 hypothetical protein [Bacillus infantis]